MARTNIVLDEKLIRQAVRLTGAKSKREAVDIALRKLIKQAGLYQKFIKLEGKLRWEGDLKQMRKSRV
jgi:Arc/MetJ family transcription regulator